MTMPKVELEQLNTWFEADLIAFHLEEQFFEFNRVTIIVGVHVLVWHVDHRFLVDSNPDF